MSTKKIEHALPPGTELRNGVYSIERVIGSGGFGITYLGHKKPDTTFGDSKKVVIKELFIAPNTENYNCIRDTYSKKTVRPSESLQNNFEDFKRRFKDEAETLYKFRAYEGMVQVLDYFEENGTFYFTMDYIESKDLNEVVKLRGKLSLDEALNYIRQVGSLVHKIHQQKVLHRDIKPQNILIDKNDKAFLIDFGIAKTYNNLDVVSKVSGFHTPGYAPPEQFANKINLISEAMDVHALAATFFYCVTGKNPPTLQDRNLGEDVSVCHLIPELPKGLDLIIEKAMAIKPQDRTQTVKEFLDGLAKYGTSAGGTVTEPPPQGNPNPRSSYKWLYYLIVGIALAVAAIMGMRSCGDNTKEWNKKAQDYYEGRNGVEKDYTEAVKWLRKSAEQGDAEGQFALGYMYDFGYGVEKDTTEAVKWYRNSAEQGDARGQYKLGIMYENGNGVTQDYAEAGKWYRKAAEQGNEDAKARLKESVDHKKVNNTSKMDSILKRDERNNVTTITKPYIKMISIPGRNFKLSETEVTIGQYLAFCKATNSHWPEWLEKGSEYNIYTGSNNWYHPITGVSALDADAFCKWMGGRLPTDEEWSYAASGGDSYKYAGSDILDEVGWYNNNSGGKVQKVKQKQANGYGLYDMSGNVEEWTSGSGEYPRVLCGGHWRTDAIYCSLSDLPLRAFGNLNYGTNCLGFRLAVSL